MHGDEGICACAHIWVYSAYMQAMDDVCENDNIMAGF